MCARMPRNTVQSSSLPDLATARKGRPQFVRAGITPAQVDLLATLLGLSGATRLAVAYVLIDGVRQIDAAAQTGVAQPHISRALASCRRLDAQIRKAYMCPSLLRPPVAGRKQGR